MDCCMVQAPQTYAIPSHILVLLSFRKPRMPSGTGLLRILSGIHHAGVAPRAAVMLRPAPSAAAQACIRGPFAREVFSRLARSARGRRTPVSDNRPVPGGFQPEDRSRLHQLKPARHWAVI